MISVLLGALAIYPGGSVPAARAFDPPIRISLNSDGYYVRGDRAKVHIEVAEDGYVLVLRADADGRVRVLFPLDPGDDAFVRGGREFEVRGRGDREAFAVDDRDGSGTVLAAHSAEPFHFDRFVRGDHWDYRVLAGDRVREDPEAGLLDLVTEIAGSARYDYDVVRYTVADSRAYSSSYYRSGYPCFGCGWYGYGSGLHVGLGFTFGSPYRYRYRYYDPFFYDPYYYDPFFYDPFYYRYSFYSYRPYRYSCFGNPFCYGYGRYGYPPVRSAGAIVFKGPTAPAPFVLPRQRTPLSDGVAQRPRVAGSDGPAVDTRRRSPVRSVDRRRGDGGTVDKRRGDGGSVERRRGDGGSVERRRGNEGSVERRRGDGGSVERRPAPARQSRPEARGRNRDASVDIGRDRMPVRVGRQDGESDRTIGGGRERLPVRVGRQGGESQRRDPSFNGGRDRLPGWTFQRPEREPVRVSPPRGPEVRGLSEAPQRSEARGRSEAPRRSETPRSSATPSSRGSDRAPANAPRRRN